MIHINSLLQTMSLYANRWGGSRYRTVEVAKFLNKHLYDKQKEDLKKGKEVNISLVGEALLNSRHSPMYLEKIVLNKAVQFYEIKDELGFKAQFPEGTLMLTYVDSPDYGPFEWLPIENCSSNTKRVINLEYVPILKNNSLETHKKGNKNYTFIKCEDELEKQKTLCDALTSMSILKEDAEDKLKLNRISKFNKNNDQEIYIVDIEYVKPIFYSPYIDLKLLGFSHMLQKDRELSAKSENRLYNAINNERPKKYLNRMRNSVFRLSKDKVSFDMELVHEENND